MSASIDKTKSWWTPDQVYHYDAEKNYLLKTIGNILAEIRKKGAPFSFELKSDKARSQPKASTSAGGVVASTPTSASRQDRSHSGLFDPQAQSREPPRRLKWLEDPRLYGRYLAVHGTRARGAGMIIFRNVVHPDQILLQEQVLLVRTKGTYWGFPKGGEKDLDGADPRHGPFETILQNAVREVREETSVTLKRLIVIKDIYIDEAHTGTRYMVAVCLAPFPGEPDYMKSTWKPLNEDEDDENPVIDARWIAVDTVIDCERNSMNAKRRVMHRDRVTMLSKARWIMKDTIVACGVFPNIYVPGGLHPGVYPNPEFHSRCLPLDWALDSLYLPSSLKRCQNGQMWAPKVPEFSQYSKRGSKETMTCPRCQGVGEIPVFDNSEWLIYAQEYANRKASKSKILPPMRDPPLPVSMQTCPICAGYKIIPRRDLDHVMQKIKAVGFSNEAGILSDQQMLPHQQQEIERREAQERRSPPPPHRSDLPRGSPELRLGGASVSAPTSSPSAGGSAVSASTSALKPRDPPRDHRESMTSSGSSASAGGVAVSAPTSATATSPAKAIASSSSAGGVDASSPAYAEVAKRAILGAIGVSLPVIVEEPVPIVRPVRQS